MDPVYCILMKNGNNPRESTSQAQAMSKETLLSQSNVSAGSSQASSMAHEEIFGDDVLTGTPIDTGKKLVSVVEFRTHEVSARASFFLTPL